MVRRVVLVAVPVLLAGLLTIAPASRAESNDVAPAMGHGLATRLCTNCHLVDPGQANPPDHVGGPAFQTIADTTGVTRKSLRHHLRTTHAAAVIPLSMPTPQLSDDEMNKVISYILSLRAPKT
jgi:mono/diheme cytochrome c family protein